MMDFEDKVIVVFWAVILLAFGFAGGYFTGVSHEASRHEIKRLTAPVEPKCLTDKQVHREVRMYTTSLCEQRRRAGL